MKFNKRKNILVNSRIQNVLNGKILLATTILLFIIIMLLSACSVNFPSEVASNISEVSSATEETHQSVYSYEEDSQSILDYSESDDAITEENITESYLVIDEENIIETCLEIAEQYKSIYLNYTEDASYSEDDICFSNEDYDEILELLDSLGYAVMYTNWDDTKTLMNSQSFQDFWEKVLLGENASFTVITITDNGELSYYSYELKDGQKLRIDAYMQWDEDGNPEVISIDSEEIDFWDYTEKGNFLYKLSYAPRWRSGARGLIRIESEDSELLNYGEKYIGIVGYDTHNLFLIDWDESDFETLNFNDLFDNLYCGSNDDYFYVDQYEYDMSSSYYYITSDVFEPLILQYFNISQNDLQSLALYNEEYQGYPWAKSWPIHSNYSGYMRADVQSYVDNGDGTATMIVDVICTECTTDLLFTHELTVRNLSNGEFQFVSNKILFYDEETFPTYTARVSE